MEAALDFELMDSAGDTLILEGGVTPGSHLLEAGLKTKWAFFKLAKFLVAHCHVVKDLKSNVFVSLAPCEIDHVENTMSLLKKQESIVELIFLNVG